jgi:hypothetical protein
MRHWLGAVTVIAGVMGLVGPSAAKVIKFEIVKVESPAFEGRNFGAVGTYDRIVGRATIAVSPDDPHNTVIVDLDRAPRNSQGLVEAVTDVEILRPTVAASGAAAIAKAAQQLVHDRLLLEDDAKLLAPNVN